MAIATHRVLVSGGTGFFGRALLRHWVAQDMHVPEVTVLTRSSQAFLSRYPEFGGLPWLHFHEGNVLEPGSLPPPKAFTHVIHAATDSTLGPKLSPIQRYDQIVEGTRNLLDFSLKCGVKRFLLTSSGGVYGPQPSDMDMIPEDYHGAPDTLNPANAYSIAKIAAEHLCVLYRHAYGIETIIARCFAFVGRDLPLNVHFAIGNFIRDALWRDSISVAGDGTPLRSYLDQQDLAHWLLTLLDRGGEGQAYNVGSDQAISIAGLAALVRDLVAPGKAVRILGEKGEHAGRNRYVPCIRKAREELGLDVRVPLAEAIKATADAARRCADQNKS